MKKNTIKAFTLVEMLIVIVIIGILIAALMPRMQSAQWRARDVARKNDLSQIQTAIVTSYQDKWKWPGKQDDIEGNPTEWMSVRKINDLLITAWMSAVPGDPLKSNTVSWLGDTSKTLTEWEYGYIVVTKNGTAKWWFVLMAKTEVEWWSNRIVCGTNSGQWTITAWMDIKDIYPCTTMKKVTTSSCKLPTKWDTNCEYTEEWQLRYILTY